MPTYDYVCRACEHQVEIFQSITAEPIRKCPQCGELKLKRLIGAGAGILFKGSGFYETDYRSSDYKKKAEAEKSSGESADKSGSKASQSSDSKTPSQTKSPPSKAESATKANE